MISLGVFGGYRIGKGGSTWCAETRDAWHSVMCGTVPPCRTTSCTKLIFSAPKAFMQVKNPFYNCLNLKLNTVLHTNIICLFVCMILKYTEFSWNANYYHINWGKILFCLCFLIKSCSPFQKKKNHIDSSNCAYLIFSKTAFSDLFEEVVFTVVPHTGAKHCLSHRIF